MPGRGIVILMLSLCCTFLQAQKFVSIDLYHPFGMKRLRVYENEVLIYKLKGENRYRKSTIDFMGDSLLYMNNGDTVNLKDIKSLKTGRSNYLTRILYRAGIQGGIFLICIDSFNHLITSDPGIMDERVAKVAGGMIATGIVIRLLSVRRVHPGKNKRLRIIDLSLNNSMP